MAQTGRRAGLDSPGREPGQRFLAPSVFGSEAEVASASYRTLRRLQTNLLDIPTRVTKTGNVAPRTKSSDHGTCQRGLAHPRPAFYNPQQMRPLPPRPKSHARLTFSCFTPSSRRQGKTTLPRAPFGLGKVDRGVSLCLGKGQPLAKPRQGNP